MQLRSWAALLAGAGAIAACGLIPGRDAEKAEPETNAVANIAEGEDADSAAGRRLCASGATYERLKMLAFEEARRVNGRDAAPLDALSRATVVRMERPLVLSRDEELGVTVCSGRFVLELPPGAARAFDGRQRLVADIEYSAQEAADGSGPVFQMSGAEPIVFRLASFGGVARAPVGQAQAPVQEPAPVPEPRVAQADPAPIPAPAPPPPPPPAPRPREVAAAPAPVPAPRPAATRASPSFNCRYAGTPSERAVCSDTGLAAKDRRMAAAYYAAYDRAPPAARRELSRSRAAFLRRRERCSTDDCIGAVYDDRIAEIRRMSGN